MSARALMDRRWSLSIQLAGACGNGLTITNNACTTVRQTNWAQPAGGPFQYYVIQVLGDTWPNPWLIQPDCSRENGSPTGSGNTAVQSSYAYCYSPNENADQINVPHAVPIFNYGCR